MDEFRLAPPVLDDGVIIVIRGNTLGSVIQCAPALRNPAKFFRVRGI